ncbi:MAG TPA: protoglobin domain-containing protein [Thermomicrobiales bacterium]|nr:protoglobin domain-containing protein [Thermomicrobiales bacterium]
MTETNRATPIAGYTYGTTAVAPSPVSLAEFDLLEQTATFGPDDVHWLRRAGAILAGQAEDMVDTWRAVIATYPHLAHYSAGPDGEPNRRYSAASKPRFVQWVRDTCERPYDQTWLDYQHEIGLRHTRAKKNRTDDAASAPHIPLRYLLAFVPVVLLTTKPFLEKGGAPAEDVERMYAAWCKAVLLQVTLWSRAYCDAADW